MMKLVFIYGPPVVGKFTVSKELSKITNYKIFHNHLTFDLVSSIFDFGTKEFGRLSSNLRYIVFSVASKNDVSLIFTFCYVKDIDDKFVKRVISIVNKNKGKVRFVQLCCKEKELYKKVKHRSRENFDKINKADHLKKTLNKWDLFSKIDFANGLSIDNTNIAQKKVAKIIKMHFKL